MKKINRNKKVILVVSILILIIITIGCISDQDRFIGEWTDQDGDTHHFFSDGNFNSYSGTITQSGQWKLKDDKLVLSMDGQELTYNYAFSNNDKTLKLTGPQSLILTKK